MFAVVAVVIGSTVLFLVGDRDRHNSPLDRRRDAAWAVVRGAVGLVGGWVLWFATGEPLWLLLLIFLPVSLYLVISGSTDLVLLFTRDRELLRREEAALRRDRPMMEAVRDAERKNDLMRRAGMTDEEIEHWANQRFDQAQIELDKLLSDEDTVSGDPVALTAFPEAQPGPVEGATRPIREANPLHAVANEMMSAEFRQCWNAAGRHLDARAQGMRSWLKAEPYPPYLEHLSFRLGSQLYFVRLEDADGRVNGPGSRQGLLAIAEGCGGWPCLMPMRQSGGQWTPARPGWGLVDLRTSEAIDPPTTITNERIEMSAWEVQDFAVQVVRDQLKDDGCEIMSSQGNPQVDPAIWFVEDGHPAWVVVRSVRFPELKAELPHNWRQIAQGCRGVSEVGYFASVAVAGGQERSGEETDIRLLRGHPLYARYEGLRRPKDDDVDAAEEEYIGRGRLASRHRRPRSREEPSA